ncbi:uncharacterized protein LOC101740429 isoform X2 [Bombyx mori]|uniref:uncharacterized protein LOC101740429 isoform X2 n=1 Tax=Bombyx mori TaxID=7091 RepID=UPI002ED233E6
MRSCSALALFTLAVLTECLAASDRSRHRSGPVRSVPVAANVKRDVDFDCPEEFGYYPHPTDCTLYYVCVFGGALLESCTGGLMYSHELQTCDWPRNVGCDGASAGGGEELERFSERDDPPPPPPPPRRTPPPPRAQPKPIITSRGQPKFNRVEYEKQQQLYAEIDDLPPVEEIESDRQQRVYRGQPSTIGQVQKDRDGYGSQAISSGRTVNSNIIPASLPQAGKIGSFSFGSQIDDRRAATITPAPQKYNLEPTENLSPVSYSPSPRPKMLYNGSQAYNPDQYDPYYAVYDEDGELYKDTDYVQQYNVASVRPAVQQTYRGTPPPARRPVETYTARPVSADDYDDALIQGQISNQNQYQAPVRHSTRGEGNELGYEHNPSSIRTTLYETTSISTTSSTTTSTTTTTTTQRPTTAPYTEAMTPSRYTPRSSTDENPTPKSDTSSTAPENDPTPSTTPSHINLSYLAKPFEITDNLHRLEQTLPTTEKMLTSRRSSRVTNNNNNIPVDVEQVSSNKGKKKLVSLTTGFSIRRNLNNTNNPYTLTVLTRPIDEFNNPRKNHSRINNSSTGKHSQRYRYEISDSISNDNISRSEEENNSFSTSAEPVNRRTDITKEITEEYDIPIPIMPPSRKLISVETTTPTTTTTKYYLKTVIKRPSSVSTEQFQENTVSTESILRNQAEKADVRSQDNILLKNQSRSDKYKTQTEPFVSPYRTLDNLRNSYRVDEQIPESSSVKTTSSTTTQKLRDKSNSLSTRKAAQLSRVAPSYYSYRLEDEVIPNHTTEVFSGKVKHVIQAFLNNVDNSPIPQLVEKIPDQSSTTPASSTEERIVNIGFQRKSVKYTTEKPLRNNVKRLQIVTESSIINTDRTNLNKIKPSENDETVNQDFALINTVDSVSTTSVVHTTSTAAPVQKENYEQLYVPSRDYYSLKFNSLVNSTDAPARFVPASEKSQKFKNVMNLEPSTESVDVVVEEDSEKKNDDQIVNNNSSVVNDEQQKYDNGLFSDIASTTSTTKATTTIKSEQTTTTTTTVKSISFPTRASRVNPAIKLAATNLGGGRRSYQSTSKCSSDNSLQPNPKCNEIKYQRPTSTRGRGSAHFSTSSGSDAPLPPPNRGTPPTRSRPTLKPSTAIVSKTTEFVDIYNHPPSRPASVYPQPTPDKTAAKCRKDVCLLPDCYCGGKEIPGNLPVSEVPQMILITFDDAVNDLNKMYYEELFQRGRVNPNGCPITATFYVSHEWTDYSQVQNLYAEGHEFASHTVSHSFGEQFSQKKWNREVAGQREILAAYGGVKLEDVRGMRAPFLSVGGNKMFKMLYDSNFTYDSSLPVYENRPPSWPYTLDYKLFHDCMIPPCPTKSYPGVWEVPMVMWQDLNGGRCSMGDACANPPEPENVYKMILKNFDRHYSTNRAPFGLFYHAAWFTQPHHKEGFIMFLDHINQMPDVWIVTNWQALQWVRDPTPISRINNFQPFQCNYQDRPKKCNNPKVCNLWHKSGVRYMRTCQPCPEVYPWTGKTGIRSSRIDNDIGE